MATFNFGGARDTGVSVNGTSTLAYTEGGINFTWTMSGGDGSLNAFGIGGGDVTGTVGFGPHGETFTLDVTGTDGFGDPATRFDGTIVIDMGAFNGSWTVNGQPLVPGNNTLTGPQSELVFTYVGSTDFHFITINSLTATINCFTAGTHIATPDGPRAVETLQAGDLVLTASGAVQPVKWLGQTKVDTRLMHPAKVNPICITAGALGGGLPERDLHLSADHAIEIDGALYNAGALVNGTTIYQLRDMPREGFTYYHIETEAHELLLAEGVAAESFIDYADRNTFDNVADAEQRVIPEMEMPRVSTARLVPEELRTRLAEIAGLARKAA
ncbi:Hint domain-containing protein [Primorskyibacter aestuariivivens]|uniref:Hint domain-containing protein n=1 Tax=Primorskyibacter aestuariivivens TaxID=1888912 RepID=UPI0022FFF348|nr:Hint domain-containing protein [Primorskyibacter aestuariivivens]MDA7429595.1 Hint domain-containing protein [Primorskyibacter aestuariivivens]